MPHGALVVTTIYDTPILEAYQDNLARHQSLESIHVFLIPDRKTPHSMLARIPELRHRGLRVTCPSLSEQEDFLRRLGLPTGFIPYDSDNRRNVGFLMALDAGVDFVISIDDDNYCLETEDFVAAHAMVCQEHQGEMVSADSGWFNLCDLLEFDRPGPVYPRGFPYYARHRDNGVRRTSGAAPIHLNAGLWLTAPDVDGISWLVNPLWSRSFQGNSVVLDRGVWTPLNTQNTALRAEALPAYYYIRMNYPLLGGLPIDRYGDILSGYFIQACAHHLGGVMRVGTPLADHRRHSHNFLTDALREMACLALMEDLLPWLTREARLEGASYADAYECLSYSLQEAVEKFSSKLWNDVTRAFFHQTAYCMRTWLGACRSLLGK